jgi:hypothetical protein
MASYLTKHRDNFTVTFTMNFIYVVRYQDNKIGHG